MLKGKHKDDSQEKNKSVTHGFDDLNSKERIEKFCESIRNSNLDNFDYLYQFDEIKDLFKKKKNRKELLCAAAHFGNIDIFNRLLEIDAVKDIVAADNNRALKVASKYGRPDIVNRLLQFQSVKKDIGLFKKKPILCHVDLNNHFTIAATLIEHGADTSELTQEQIELITRGLASSRRSLNYLPLMQAFDSPSELESVVKGSHEPRIATEPDAMDVDGALVSPKFG